MGDIRRPNFISLNLLLHRLLVPMGCNVSLNEEDNNYVLRCTLISTVSLLNVLCFIYLRESYVGGFVNVYVSVSLKWTWCARNLQVSFCMTFCVSLLSICIFLLLLSFVVYRNFGSTGLYGLSHIYVAVRNLLAPTTTQCIKALLTSQVSMCCQLFPKQMILTHVFNISYQGNMGHLCDDPVALHSPKCSCHYKSIQLGLIPSFPFNVSPRKQSSI